MSTEHRTQAEKASSRGYTLNDVLAPENLALAWKQVKANRGAAGIDGMEIGDFPSFIREHWETLRGKLENDAWLEEQGVPSLEEQWIFIRYQDGPKRTNG